MDWFKCLGLQVLADGRCEMDVVHRMYEGYKTREALKSVLGQCYSKCGTRTGDGTRTIVYRYADIFQKRETMVKLYATGDCRDI